MFLVPVFGTVLVWQMFTFAQMTCCWRRRGRRSAFPRMRPGRGSCAPAWRRPRTGRPPRWRWWPGRAAPRTEMTMADSDTHRPAEAAARADREERHAHDVAEMTAAQSPHSRAMEQRSAAAPARGYAKEGS